MKERGLERYFSDMWRVKGEGWKGCGRGFVIEGGGFSIGVLVLFCFGLVGDGNCCVFVVIVLFLIGGVVVLDGIVVVVIGVVVDVGIVDGIGIEGCICLGDGCCVGGFGGLELLIIGMVFVVFGVLVIVVIVVFCWVGGCCCCCCWINKVK